MSQPENDGKRVFFVSIKEEIKYDFEIEATSREAAEKEAMFRLGTVTFSEMEEIGAEVFVLDRRVLEDTLYQRDEE